MFNDTTARSRPLTTIKNEIEGVARAIAAHKEQALRISFLKGEVARLTTETLLNPNEQSRLLHAHTEMKEAERALASLPPLNTRKAALDLELEMAIADERLAQQQEIERRYGEVASRYKHSCLQAAEQHRALLSFCSTHGIQQPPNFSKCRVGQSRPPPR